ncbi:MAG: DNA repair protein [Burkholderiales bacterium]|nr:DNA repair protein [Burkholderiales bacterium]
MLRVEDVTVPYGNWSPEESEILGRAMSVLNRRLRGPVLSSPDVFKQYLRLRIGGLGYEVFGLVFLDAQHAVIAIEEMFRGTLTQTTVHPREVVMRALHHNCAACVAFHNHPSGHCDPSSADELITAHLKRALDLVDVKLLDHFVVSAESAVSFAQRGLI